MCEQSRTSRSGERLSLPIALAVLLACSITAGVVASSAAGSEVGRASVVSSLSRERACGGPCILFVSFRGSGSGRVVSDSASIDCRSSCSAALSPATKIVLSAQADAGSWVTSWTGCGEATPTTCTVVMPLDDVDVIVVFDLVGGPVTPPPAGTPPPPPTISPAAPTVNPLGCMVVGTSGSDVLVGTPGRDVICALGGDDHIHGGDGPDLVYAGAGADRVEAGRGDDRVYGGRGRDRLFGEAGADLLVGGAGRDVMRGMAGADTLYARDRFRDTLAGGPGRDRARRDPFDRATGIERSF